jgi:hypothetical protein
MRKEASNNDGLLKEAFGIEEEFGIEPEEERYLSSRFSPMMKRSEIIKRIRSNLGSKLPELDEEDIPEDIQDVMSSRLSDALSTAGGMGIVAKPREFQRMYIRAIGRPDLADDLHHRGICFRQGGPPAEDFRLSGSILPRLLRLLLPLMAGRSGFSNPLHKRTVIIIKNSGAPPQEEMDSPLLEKVSSAYSAYRRDLIYKVAELIKTAAHESSHIYESASIHKEKLAEDVLSSLISPLSADYLNGAYLPKAVSEFVHDNPTYNGLEKAGQLYLSSVE